MDDVDVELQFIPIEVTGTPDELDTFIGTVLDELDRLGWDEVDVTATLAQRKVIFSVFDLELEQQVKFRDALQTALQAAGAYTPGWNHGLSWGMPHPDEVVPVLPKLHLWAVGKVVA